MPFEINFEVILSGRGDNYHWLRCNNLDGTQMPKAPYTVIWVRGGTKYWTYIEFFSKQEAYLVRTQSVVFQFF